jgi:hypothetical protein
MNEEAVTEFGVVRSRRFTTAFPTLPAYDRSRSFLADLGGSDGPMVGDESTDGDASASAGLAFFGQFVDHEITFDPTSDLLRRNDPAALRNFKTPALDLDSVYGDGPEVHPYLYDERDEAKLFLDTSVEYPVAPADTDRERAVRFGAGDVQRNAQGVAVTNDPRNDENVLISQMLLAFVKFHNRVVDYLRSGAGGHLWEGEPRPDDAEAVREEAERVVTWHYQWLVVEEFLPRVCDRSVVDEVRAGDRRVVRGDPERVSIPVEFAGAAYRYGHSQIRERYRVNDDHEARFFPGPEMDETGGGMPDIEDLPVDPEDLPFDPGDEPIEAMSKPGGTTEESGGDDLTLAGFGPVPDELVVDWRYFFPHGSADDRVQPARKIDATLPRSLFFLPFVEGEFDSLAARNLLRGRALRLPSGQAVAERLDVAALSNDELPVGSGSFDDVLRAAGRGADEAAPLWLYVLAEADAQQDGDRLGAVGSRLVAEVLTGLARSAESTYLDAEDWRPTLPRVASLDADPTDDPDGEAPYRFADLFEFATGPSPDGLRIAAVDADGTGEAPPVANSTDGEAVVVDHHGDGPLDLGDYRLDLGDDEDRRPITPADGDSLVLSPGDRAVVYTGDDAPNDADLRTATLGHDRPVLANDGSDVVTALTGVGVVSDWR